MVAGIALSFKDAGRPRSEKSAVDPISSRVAEKRSEAARSRFNNTEDETGSGIIDACELADTGVLLTSSALTTRFPPSTDDESVLVESADVEDEGVLVDGEGVKVDAFGLACSCGCARRRLPIASRDAFALNVLGCCAPIVRVRTASTSCANARASSLLPCFARVAARLLFVHKV